MISVSLSFYVFLSIGSMAIETQILAAQIETILHLETVVSESRKFVAQTREIKEVTMEAYHAIDDLREFKWEDLKGHALYAIWRTYPDLRDIYADIDNISDLRRRSPRAKRTLEGMIHKTLWAPFFENIDALDDRTELIAEISEHQARQEALLDVSRAELHALQEDCRKGHGACQEAGNRAVILSALLATDTNDSLRVIIENMRQHQIDEQNKIVSRHKSSASFLAAVNTSVRTGLNLNNGRSCDGDCLYKQFAFAAQKDLQERLHRNRKR